MLLWLNMSESKKCPSQLSTTRLAKQKNEICCSEVRNFTNVFIFTSAMDIVEFHLQ